MGRAGYKDVEPHAAASQEVAADVAPQPASVTAANQRSADKVVHGLAEDRPLDSSSLNEATERARVKENHGAGQLVPFGPKKPGAEPVVIVHGRGGAPEDFDALISQYAADAKSQVYVFLYNDTGKYLDHSGTDLANSLVELAGGLTHDGVKPSVRIVAHSMGGIVVRCAMNTLANPGWLVDATGGKLRGSKKQPQQGASSDRAHADDFEKIDAVTVDTPWRGFSGAPFNVRNAWPKETSAVDMVSSSSVLKEISNPELPENMTLSQIEADQRADGKEPDGIVGFGELKDKDIDMLVAYYQGDESVMKRDRKLANQLRALEDTRGYAEFAEQARAEAQAGLLTRTNLRSLLASFVPQIAGTHTSVLANPALPAAIAGDPPAK